MSTKSRWFYVCFGLTLIGFIATDCPFPKQNQENLQFHYQSSRDARRTIAPENYLLKFRCSPGYTRIGPRAIVCIDSEWTSDIPSCEKIQCPEPPSIENGEYELRSVVNNTPAIGASAFYICKLGYDYENDTESSLTCVFDHEQNSANWSGEIPTCKEKISCPDPEVSKDGDRKGSCCYSGDVLQFSCNSNYELVGSKAIECLSTGSWNSTRPLCKPTGIHCEMPPLIRHGLITGYKDGDYFRPYDELEVVCEPGYSYKGPNQFVMCEEKGVWEEEFGECLEIFCDPPEPLENGAIPEVMATNLTSFPYNFEITYVCNKGFRLVGGDGWSFCGKRGWFGKIPYCEEIHCPEPDSPEHGSREVHSLKVGAKVYFSCFSKYYLLGSFERYCMPNGQWSGELARCDTETNYCPEPGIPINGFKNTTNYDEGVWVRFRCRSGYILVGSELRKCLHNRTWSGKEPKCLGPYDYDNNAHVRDILKAAITKTAEEQEKEIQKYREAMRAVWNSGPVGRILDLRYPGRYILYFIFDTSGSIGRGNFDKSIELAKAIVKKVGIKENGARAGAVTFSSTAVHQFLPLYYDNTQDTLDALDRIEYTGGGTSINSGLELVRMELLPLVTARFGAKAVKNVVFILTDGKANMGGSPQEEANKLKASGAEIYSIGITGNILKKTLYQISSDPTDEHVFILENYSTLAWLVQEITNGTIDYSECGLGVENVPGLHSQRPRIVGGQQAFQPWPWMAAIYLLPLGSVNPADAMLQCSGTIIHERFILTVAQCMYGTDKTQQPVLRNVKEIMIKLGLTDLKDESYVQKPEVLSYFIHPKYRPGAFYDYDIALLYLRTPIEFNAYARPVCLPPADLPENTTFYKVSEFGIATGWGHERTITHNPHWEMKLTDKLKQVILPIPSIDRCRQSLVDHKVNLSIFTDRMFCAGNENVPGGGDTYYGDTGGPLMQSHLNSEGYLYWTQVGIVSWGIGSGLANTYGYYTHVQRLRLWIDNTIEDAIKESF